MLFDFHTHTTLSDGELSPVEMIRRAAVAGYTAVALTDHAGPGELSFIIEKVVEDCRLANAHWNILAIPGIELTHLPPETIAEAARRAKVLGAQIVIVHGESIVEPVPPGTNRAAILCPEVDILAHPGLLTAEDAQLAAQRGTYLEISARAGHSLTNGHIVRQAGRAGAPLLLNSDAHSPDDLLNPSLARSIAQGAGLESDELEEALHQAPQALLRRLGLSLKLNA